MRHCLLVTTASLALLLGGCANMPKDAPKSVAAAPAEPAPLAELVRKVDIPYEIFTLPNGLTTIVHTDRKAPIVGVSVWYRVGSKHEPKGKTGFAHLFEHLMFGGSENVPNFDKPLEAAGSTPTNGSTWLDRTNYVETVPTGALDLALFMESDRMGHLLGAVTQEKLDQQRGVVQNEKRQGDNQPYGIVEYEIQETLYPKGHPYHHSTIGSMDDLTNASLDDVKTWFRDNYGPNNVVLVLAGDIDAATARPKVEKWFGDIPRGPDVKPVDAPVTTLPARVDKTITDQVATTRLYRSWVVPGLNHPDAAALYMGMSVLGGLSSSRLDNALVRDEQLAVSVTAGFLPFEHSSWVQSYIDVKPGVDRAVAEKRYEELLADFIANGPTEDELRRAATSYVAAQIGQLEEVGGFGGKGSTLAEGQLYSSDPEKYKKDLEAIASLTPMMVRDAMQRWLTRPVFALAVEPGERKEGGENRGGYRGADAETKGSVDGPRIGYRTGPDTETGAGSLAMDETARPARAFPPVDPVGDLEFPKIERATLSNGMKVSFARRTAIPKVRVSVSFDAGFAADAVNARGTQSFMMELLSEGTTSRSSIAIAEESERLGANIGTGASLDESSVSMSALSANLAPSLALMADVIRNPAFADGEVERVRAQQLAQIGQEMNSPVALGYRAMAPILYGKDHPYGGSLTGTGDAAIVEKLTAADLRAAHKTWLRPDNAQITIVGDTSMAQILPLLEKSFGDWKAPATPRPEKAVNSAVPAANPRIVVIDRPNSPQSVILAGKVLSLTGRDPAERLETVNEIMGAGFLSRINTNLRETKGWSYGVRSSLLSTRGRRAQIVMAPVQSDRTGDSIRELVSDMKALPATLPVTDEEFNRVIDGNIRGLPNRFESSGDVLNAVQTIDRLGRPDDYYVKLPTLYRMMDKSQLDAEAARHLQPDDMVFVVVGDRKVIDSQLQSLGMPIEAMTLIDTDDNKPENQP